MLSPPPHGAARDSHGFILDAETADVTKLAELTYQREIRPRQVKLWADVISAGTSEVDAMLQGMRTSAKLKAMVRGGIPHELRARVWRSLAGASTKRDGMDDATYYRRLLENVSQRESDEQAAGVDRNESELLEQIEQIEKDLGRTFPSHSTIATPEGQTSLRRLLRAYSCGRNPRTGYCQ